MRSKRSSRIALPKSPWDNKVVRAFLYVYVAILLVAPASAQRGGGRGPSRQQLPQKTDPNEADILATFSGKVFTVTKKEVAITLLDGDHELPFRIGGKTDVLDALRLVPGSSLVQSGGRGGATRCGRQAARLRPPRRPIPALAG